MTNPKYEKGLNGISYALSSPRGDSVALGTFVHNHFMAISTLIKTIGNDRTVWFITNLLNTRHHCKLSNEYYNPNSTIK